MPYYHSAHFDFKSLTIDNIHTKNTSEAMQRRLQFWSLFREHDQLVLSNPWFGLLLSLAPRFLATFGLSVSCWGYTQMTQFNFLENELQKDFPQIRCISGKVNEIRTIASSIDKWLCDVMLGRDGIKVRGPCWNPTFARMFCRNSSN